MLILAKKINNKNVMSFTFLEKYLKIFFITGQGVRHKLRSRIKIILIKNKVHQNFKFDKLDLKKEIKFNEEIII